MRSLIFFIALFCAHQVLASDALLNSIQGTERLLESSVSAKKISSGTNQEALDLQNQARSLLQQAKQAVSDGQADKAKQLVLQSKKMFFQAVRLVGNGVKKAGKQKKYDSLEKSLASLTDALKRIGQEKKAETETNKILQVVSESKQKAKSLLKQNKLQDAVDTLEKSYLSVKLSIQKLREGDTLVRELKFASKEEEYEYEKKRNNTHRVLIDILLTDKLKNPKYAKLMQKPLEKAEELKQQAENAAQAQEFETALELMEKSTRQIIRAIRSAGIYIPG